MIKAIDTLYNGNYFRSRLEARWAVFFDFLKIEYQYEPQGFKNENGECYLPDFYLPETYLRDNTKGVYVEIKHENFNISEFKAGDWFSGLVLFTGLPNINRWGLPFEYSIKGGFEYAGDGCSDDDMMFWRCSKCETTKIEYHESNYNFCPKCIIGECDTGILYLASEHAAETRFEHKHSIA